MRRAHGGTVEGVPRWAVIAAYGASLVVLPSCIWRIALGFGAPIGPYSQDIGDANGDLPGWMPMWAYTVLLSVVSEALAFLAVGLVSRWGEVFPRWIPHLGGRRGSERQGRAFRSGEKGMRAGPGRGHPRVWDGN